MWVASLTLLTVDGIGTGVTEFRFRPARPLPFRQAALLVVPGRGAKPFTIASAEQASTLNIATEVHPNSRFKQALADLRPGNRVLLAGAGGLLSKLDASTPHVFVAQSIGVTPR
jgi:predicted ferric reductase